MTKKHWGLPAKIGAMLALTALLVTFISGCALFSATGKSAGGRVKAKAGRQRLEFEGDKGKLVVEESGQSLPKGFPTDMPIYRPSKVKSTVSSQGASETPMTMAILETKAEVAKVAAFYQAQLPAKGWTVTGTVSLDRATGISVTKVNQVGSLSITEDKDAKATIISINVALR